MFLAIKEIKKDKGRFLLVISIIALISYLVFFLIGLAYGLAMDNRTVVDNFNAKKIVLKSGNNSNIYSSILEESSLEDFKDYDITPININRAVAYIDGVESKESSISVVLVGMEEDSFAIPKLVEGRNPNNSDEVLASISLKREENINLEQSLKISQNDRVFKIVGFVENSKFNISPAIYTGLYDASSAMMNFKENQNQTDANTGATKSVPKRFSAILIHNDADVEKMEGYDILTINDFINELPGYIPQVLTFGMMIIFLILISSVVLGVFMYIITIQKKETFGVMKVQGISNSFISKSVVIQTLIVSLIGLVIGLGFTILTALLIPVKVPFRVNYLLYFLTIIIIILISLLGAIFSVKGVSKVDPLEVLN